jgi:hypothetical protein
VNVVEAGGEVVEMREPSGGPVTTGQRPTPADLDRTIELVRAAYAEAMRGYGLLPGTVMTICASAELIINTALEPDP